MEFDTVPLIYRGEMPICLRSSDHPLELEDSVPAVTIVCEQDDEKKGRLYVSVTTVQTRGCAENRRKPCSFVILNT